MSYVVKTPIFYFSLPPDGSGGIAIHHVTFLILLFMRPILQCLQLWYSRKQTTAQKSITMILSYVWTAEITPIWKFRNLLGDWKPWDNALRKETLYFFDRF